MHITRCSLDPDSCVPYAGVNFTMKDPAAAALGLRWSDIGIMLCEALLWLCYGYIMVLLWLCCGWCDSLDRDCVKAAVPARREETYL